MTHPQSEVPATVQPGAPITTEVSEAAQKVIDAMEPICLHGNQWQTERACLAIHALRQALASAPLPDTEGYPHEAVQRLVAALEPLLENADGYDKSTVRAAYLGIPDSDILLSNWKRRELLDNEERARAAWKALRAAPLGERNTPQTEGDPLRTCTCSAECKRDWCYFNAAKGTCPVRTSQELVRAHLAAKISSGTGPAPQPPSKRILRAQEDIKQALAVVLPDFKPRATLTDEQIDFVASALVAADDQIAIYRSEVGARPSPLETEKEGFPDGGA